MSSTLKEIATGKHTHDRYIQQTAIVQHAVVDIKKPQRKHSIIYTLVHADAADERSAAVDVFLLTGLQTFIKCIAVVSGDQPVYTLLIEIKIKHPQKYDKIIPLLGPIHMQHKDKLVTAH